MTTWKEQEEEQAKLHKQEMEAETRLFVWGTVGIPWSKIEHKYEKVMDPS